jgi:glycosidase
MAVDHRTHDQIERRLRDVDLQAYAAGPHHPSPDSWQDQLLYFVMLDRFSDGQERGTFVDANGQTRDAYRDNAGARVAAGTTPLFDFVADAFTAERRSWADAGGTWCGGTLAGLRSKLGYLRRLGVTGIWISPVFKQVQKTYDLAGDRLVDTHSYHGYGIQNFIDVDPRFGTRQDLRDLVDEAHRLGLYVILDVILNHAGDVFEYDADRYSFGKDNKPLGINPAGRQIVDARWDGGTYPARGYRNSFGAAVVPFGAVDETALPGAWPNDAIWPAELQPPATFGRQGRITGWDHDPEFIEGDFESLKEIHHGHHDRDAGGARLIGDFHPSAALMHVVQAYKFWIAYADVDGYRVDTVKHMERGATRLFASAMHEFAQSLGKERFFLLGEITGGRQNAFETMTLTGLDAALGIDDVAEKMEYLPKGYRDARTYFDLFRNAWEVGQDSHVWLGQHLVTMFDDHDKVGRAKRRYCGDKLNRGYDLLVPALALNLATLGIPCLYYGTEQGFDGDGDNDRFLRECMFGGPFGSLQSANRHFFNEEHPIYRRISEIAGVVRRKIALRRGRQYLRQISAPEDGSSFGYPHMIDGQMRSVVPWSRLFNDREVLCAINTDPDEPRTAWVTIDASLHAVDDQLTCVYSTDEDEVEVGHQLAVEARNGKAVLLTVPAAGFVVFE